MLEELKRKVYEANMELPRRKFIEDNALNVRNLDF